MLQVVLSKLCIQESLVIFPQRAFKRESEVENWIQTYDSEMGEKQVRPAELNLL